MTNKTYDTSDFPPVELDPTIKDGEIIEKQQKLSLEYDNDIKALLIQEIQQRIKVRQAAFVCAAVVMVAIAIFAVVLFCTMPREHFILFTPSYLTVVSIVAPIMSISAICITILLGAFRKSATKEDDNINLTSLAAEAIKPASFQG